mmetsp:Transcript_57408/g.136446  ORF Transcript_57408/g.136446 Transcript_57408/m.136446 type:complete len:305 (-) Transcript_57408:73-987(-)
MTMSEEPATTIEGCVPSFAKLIEDDSASTLSTVSCGCLGSSSSSYLDTLDTPLSPLRTRTACKSCWPQCECSSDSCSSGSSPARSSRQSVLEAPLDRLDDATRSETPLGAEHVATVEAHLSAMNYAAEQVNDAQKVLADLERERNLQLKAWESGSANLVEKIGSDRVTRACRRVAAQRQSESALEAVEEVSRRYKEAAEAGAAREVLANLQVEHAGLLAVYTMAQQRLSAVTKAAPLSQAAQVAVAPFLSAEAIHQKALRAVDAEVGRVKLVLCASRRRYAEALRDLECLSEQVHRERGSLQLQ